ncbi:hypothetical protein D1007_09908 [Hordeum vulgare]|nr:hypothetical protein D1007_09908 [Hordeum vulgare]
MWPGGWRRGRRPTGATAASGSCTRRGTPGWPAPAATATSWSRWTRRCRAGPSRPPSFVRRRAAADAPAEVRPRHQRHQQLRALLRRRRRIRPPPAVREHVRGGDEVGQGTGDGADAEQLREREADEDLMGGAHRSR